MSNSTTISGKCWEPSTRCTQSGMFVTEFSVSVYDGKDKETQKSKYFNKNCKAFGQLAENIGNQVLKGDELLITGKNTVESWDDKDTGKKQYKEVLIIDEIGKIISRFAPKGNSESTPPPKTPPTDSGYDVSSFGTEVFPEEEIPF